MGNNMEIPKAPPVACWALMLFAAYGGVVLANSWLFLLAVILLLAGIFLYEQQRKMREANEQRDREENAKAKKDEKDKAFLKRIWDFGSKYIPKPLRE